MRFLLQGFVFCRWAHGAATAAVLFFFIPRFVFGFAETDALVDEAFRGVKPLGLDNGRAKKAEALARYAEGIMAEYEGGAGAASASYRKVLAIDPANLELALAVAGERLREEDFAGALAVVKDVAKARPDDAMPQFVLADIYWNHLQKRELAEKYAKKAYALSPGEPDALGLLWDIFWRTGQRAAAKALLDTAARRAETRGDYWATVAGLLWWTHSVSGKKEEEEGDRRRRLLALEKTVEFSEEAEILVKAGDIHSRFKEKPEAVGAYRKAYRADPAYPNAAEKFGAALVIAGENDEAYLILAEVVKKNPGHLLACDQLVVYAAEKGDVEAELLYRQQALSLDGDNFLRHRKLIDRFLEEGKYELAIVYLQQAMSRFPRSGLFPYLLGMTLVRAERAAEAVPFFGEAQADFLLRGTPLEDADFYYEYAVAAEKAGLPERSEELLEKAIEVSGGGHSMSCNYLAYTWIDKNERLEEAEGLLAVALEKEPGNPAYLDSLGWLRFRQGRFGEALVLLLEAAELLEGQDPAIYDHIAEAYHALGRYPEALLYWQKSLELFPGSQVVRDKVERLKERMSGAKGGRES